MSHSQPFPKAMTFTFSPTTGVPPGRYLSLLKSIESTHHEEFGAGVKFTWMIIESPGMGMHVYRTCGPNPSLTNAAGRLMAGVLGRQIKPGEEVSLAECIGRKYRVVVGQSTNGTSTRVESCTPA
jgi:hypothetical protein